MSRKVLIAGGGTGGHLFPGVAVAKELKRLRPDLDVSFVGSGKGLESKLLSDEGFSTRKITVMGLRGKGLLTKIKSLFAAAIGLMQSWLIIKRQKPALIMAVGGYASFPLGLAAWWCNVPLAVQEQNSLPGLTNRTLARYADAVFTSFEQASSELPAEKCELLGNPVRQELLTDAQKAAETRPQPDDEFRVLILGGSQGAASINNAVADSLEHLKGLEGRISFVHQSGARQEDELARTYAERGFNAEVKGFFTNMGELYGRAHLVFCRSGAGTVTELMACGRSGVLVPFPYAAGDHQTYNAKAMADQDAAILRPDDELDGEYVADTIRRFLDAPEELSDMEARALKLSKPRAATDIAMRCLEMMKEDR